MKNIIVLILIQFFYHFVSSSNFDYMMNPLNQIIEHQNITNRLVFNPETDFSISIRHCIFMYISCDIFDNGGAISIDHPLTAFTVTHTSFCECNCFQKQGGAVFLKTTNATFDSCCAIKCYSRYGLFLQGIVSQAFSFSMSTITDCNSGNSYFTTATLNIAGGDQNISMINSSSNNLNVFPAAGISLMPNFLNMKYSTFSNNIGETILSMNYMVTDAKRQRSIESINIVNNTLRTKSPFPQAVAVFFINNCILSNSIFQRNSADYKENFYILYESMNVNTIIKDTVFDFYQSRFPMNLINCTVNETAPTHQFNFLNTEMCSGYIPSPNSNKTEKIVIICFSVIGGIMLIITVSTLVLKFRKKTDDNEHPILSTQHLLSENDENINE